MDQGWGLNGKGWDNDYLVSDSEVILTSMLTVMSALLCTKKVDSAYLVRDYSCQQQHKSSIFFAA